MLLLRNVQNGGSGAECCRRSKLPQSERSWDLFAQERYQRGETDTPSYKADNPFRHHRQGPYA